MSSLQALQAARGQLIESINALTASIRTNQRNLQRQEQLLVVAGLSGPEFVTVQNNISFLKQEIAAQLAELARLNQELADLDRQIAQAQQQEGPRESTGQTVAQAQRANDQGADVIAPSAPLVPPDAQRSAAGQTNADQFNPVAQTDSGTDAVTRTAQSLQTLPPKTASPGPARRAITPPNSPGQVIEPSDIADPFEIDQQTSRDETTALVAPSDNAAGNNNPTRAALNQIFSGQIIPEDNVLDQYASYTYSISIYLMSPRDYQDLLATPNARPPGAQLILQTGGSATGGPIIPGAELDVNIEDPGQAVRAQRVNLGRNEFFSLDYYLDDVRLTSYINGKGTSMAHNVFEIKFKVIEPNGITFLDNLYRATDQYVKSSGLPATNYAAQQYLMIIRFYGYDKDGNLVTGQNQLIPGSSPQKSVTVEKFIPFQFTNIKFRVANKLVEYDCEGVGIPNAVATAPARGTIPYNVELTSQSLRDLLQGNQAFSQGTTGTGAVSDAFRQGPDQSAAETARLQRQSDQGARSGLTQANVSTAKFAERQAAASARVRAARREQRGLSSDSATAIPTSVTAGNGTTQNSAPPKASAETSKTLVTGLANALNEAQANWVKKGTYTHPDRYFFELDPLLAEAKVVPPGSTNLRDTPMAPNENARDKLLQRTQAVDSNARKFSILAGTSIVQFLDQVVRNTSYIYEQQIAYYDPKTNKLKKNGKPANITGWYRIGMQAVPGPYDPKRNDYSYNITYRVEVYGINDARSDFFPSAQYRGTHKVYSYWFTGENTQVLDYQQDFNYIYYIVQNSASPDRTRMTTNHREVPKYFAQPRSGETDQMNPNTVSEPSAQLADYLYSPRDTANIKLRILGDPAWIQQGDVRGGLINSTQLYGAFLPDGTINYAGQEILFEVLWNKPQDYDLSTGLMDAGAKNYKANRKIGQPGQAVQTNVYRARSVISTFSRGRFEQELEGNQIMYSLPGADREDVERPDASTTNRDRLITGQGGGDQVYQGADTSPLSDRPIPITYTQQLLNKAKAATAPTSGTQIVGPPAIPTSLFGQYGATGQGTGSPAVTYTTSTGRVITATSDQQIKDAFNQGFISKITQNNLSQQLNALQQQANNPTTAETRQVIAKDN